MSTSKRFHIHFQTVAFAAAIVLALAVPATQAETFHVYGQVYAATPSWPGIAPTHDPLASYQSEIVRESEDLYAVAPKSMTRVSLFDAATGTSIVPAFVTVKDGWYHFIFQRTGSSHTVRFAVHDAASGERFLRSGEVTVSAGYNLRFLLVPASPYPAGRPRAWPDADTALFTRVGKIEMDLIDRQTGLVTTPSSRASKLAIPAYQKAPFGGNLFLFGAFSKRFHPGESGGREYCYQILVDGQPIDDPLYKTRYTVNTSSGVVNSKSVRLGPHRFGLLDNCYLLTPLNEPGNVFWSFPDLLALWRTGSRSTSAPAKVTFKLYMTRDPNIATGDTGPIIGGTGAGTSTVFWHPPLVTLASNQNSTLSLRLDNQKPTVNLALTLDGGSVGGCDILDLTANQKLEAKYKVSHPFLRDWQLWTQSNRRQSGTTHREPPKIWDSDAPEIAQGVDKTIQLTLQHACAYNFRLHAWARTTDGYGYLYRGSVEETHYVKVP